MQDDWADSPHMRHPGLLPSWAGLAFYGAWAVRKNYGGRWRASLLRALFVNTLQGAMRCLRLAARSLALRAVN